VPNVRRPQKSIGLAGSPTVRVYSTFEDWQAEQRADLRSPEQRGIHVGSPVMWRYRANGVIVTERAVVTAIDAQVLTLQVKDVEARTCSVPVDEIVSSPYGRQSSELGKRGAYIANQMETPDANGPATREIMPETRSWV
jgi:hypothetical protein